jgi:acyl carrier protein
MTEVVSGRPATWSQEQVGAIISQLIEELAPAAEGGISAKSRLVDDLGYHSLALLELAFTIEDEFSLDPIDQETAQGIVTVGDVQEYVLGQLKERDALAGPGDGSAPNGSASNGSAPNGTGASA